MTVFVITVAPEACEAYLHPQAFRKLEDAQQTLKEKYNDPAERSYCVYRDSDYTYYYIDRLEVIE